MKQVKMNMALKKIFFLLSCLAGVLSADAQYYYQDIYRTEETNRQHRQYREERIQNIQISSLDAQNNPNQDFQCRKTFIDDYGKAITETQSFSTGKDRLVSIFDAKGRVKHTIDSSATSINHTWVHYNSDGRIDSLVFSSYQPKKSGADTLLHGSGDYRLNETHVFYYDSLGTLKKMERLKGRQPSSTIFFTPDSAGRVFKEYEKNSARPIYYYKYQDKGLLSDVFHFNHTRKKMIPDFMFTYNEQGRLIQKTVVMSNSHDYLKWEYSYDPSGNIMQEKVYNKKDELQGSLLFRYE